MAQRTKTEIENINLYEKKWKIKTNKGKFRIIPLAAKKRNDIILDGTPIKYAEKRKVLRHTINRRGIEPHIRK